LIIKLCELPKLTTLKIRRNKIGLSSTNAIAKLLQKYSPGHLERLEICENKVNAILQLKLAEILVQNSNKLIHLSLEKCNFGNVAMTTLADMIGRSQLEYLNLSKCQNSPSAFAEIVFALRFNRQLRTLDISHNNLFETPKPFATSVDPS